MHQDNTQSSFRKNDSEINSRRLFLAIVLSCDPTTYNVTVTPFGQSDREVLQGILISQTMTHLLGFKEAVLPPVASTVLCFKHATNQCLILGVVPRPDSLSSKLVYPSRTIVGAGDGMNDEQNSVGYNNKSTKMMLVNQGRPTDVVEGEYVISNEFGVMLGLFQQLAMLKGSDLAMVQAYMLDDLVRIISHNFQHYTCLGETKIFHDGKQLFLEAGLTDSSKESMGMAEITGGGKNPFSNSNTIKLDDSEDYFKLGNEQRQAIERLKIFVGTLGDFINVMLTCPPNDQATRNLDGAQVDEIGFDKGLFQLRIHKDGAVAVRSVAGITLEKTNWIRVPHRIRSPEDPDGDDEANIKYDTNSSFKFNQELKYEQQPTLYFLQLRDYLAYLHENLGYAKFKKHPKDFQINDKYSDEPEINTITKVDPFTEVKYETRTSGVTLMPNGGIALRDAWGSAIIMDGGNIYLQPAKDLVAQPMRNLIGKIGGFTSLAGKKDIDLSSTEGGMRIKTHKAQYLYSDSSGIILEANGEGLSDYYPSDQALSHVSGIVCKAPNSTIANYSKYKLDRFTKTHVAQGPNFWADYEEQAFIRTETGFTLQSNTITLIAKNTLLAESEGTALLVGRNSTAVGFKDQTFGIVKFGAVQGVIKPEDFKDHFKELEDKEIDVRETITNFRDDEALDELKFRFLPSSSYQLSSEDIIPQTLVQQEYIFDNSHNLKEWEEKEVNETFPYPGKDKRDTYMTYELINLEVTGTELHNNSDSINPTEATLEPIDLFTQYPVKI